MYDVKLSKEQCREIAIDWYDFIVLGVQAMEESENAKRGEVVADEHGQGEVAA